jgi:hypothetical protein
MGILSQEGNLPIVVAQGGNVAIVGPVEELVPRPFAFTPECRHQAS